MELLKRRPSSNLYNTGLFDTNGQPIYRSVLGGVPNVPDESNNLTPFDNELKIITSHPTVKYVIKQGAFFVGFHNKLTDKFLSVVKLRSGETLTKTIVNDPGCVPTVIKKHTLQWKYGNGSWVREYATERQVKEVIFQKAGQVIKFKYKLTGFTAKNDGDYFGIYKGNRLAFKIMKPYYCDADGEFVEWVPIEWEKISDNWIVTYPAPAQDSYIDPTIVFGEGSGQTGGDHKDSWIASGNSDYAGASDTALRLWSTFQIGLLRFSLTGHIATDAIVNTSILSVETQTYAGASNVTASKITTDWGVSPVVEGATEHPAASGQATFRRSFDFNGGGGDVAWNSGNFSAGDYNAAEDTEALATLNNRTTFDIPLMTQDWINADATNYGVVLFTTVGGDNRISSQEAAVAADRPYLTVDYSVPAGGVFFFFNSKNYKHRDKIIFPGG